MRYNLVRAASRFLAAKNDLMPTDWAKEMANNFSYIQSELKELAAEVEKLKSAKTETEKAAIKDLIGEELADVVWLRLTIELLEIQKLPAPNVCLDRHIHTSEYHEFRWWKTYQPAGVYFFDHEILTHLQSVGESNLSKIAFNQESVKEFRVCANLSRQRGMLHIEGGIAAFFDDAGKIQKPMCYKSKAQIREKLRSANP